MGITDKLRAAGFKPEVSTDGEREILVGQYKTKWATIRKEAEDSGREYLQSEWKVIEVIDGTFAGNSKFPEFRRRYYLDDERDVKRLCNDAFTVGVSLDISSDEALVASTHQLIDKVTYIRGWKGTPDKDRAGNVIPEEERRSFQNFVIRAEKNAKPRKAKAGAVPF